MLNKLLKKQLKRNRELTRLALSQGGFTLIELLVVVLLSGLVVSALMALVIQLISTEQRESVQTETQREMQLAMNYIASDLRQAVYVYDGTEHPHPGSTSTPSYLEYLSNAADDIQDTDSFRPILAFWKTVPEDMETSGLPDYETDPASGNGCAEFVGPGNNPDLTRFNECNNLWLRRQNYSLVVYFQAENYTDNDLDNLNNVANANGKWKGKSRIVRYELDKYSDISDLTRKPGFVDPAELSNSEGFVSWPFEGTATASDNCQRDDCGLINGAAGVPEGRRLTDTLVDFVDLTTDATPARSLDARMNEPDSCDALNTGGGEYFMTPPRDDTNFPKPAFFVCIRDTRPPVDPANPNAPRNPRVGEIQDVVVFLRGNAQGRGITSSDSFLPTLQTRVTMRGVIDRVVR